MANNIIKGRKGGSSKQRTPTEQPDDLQSVAKAKVLIGLGEGEFAGGLTGKDIYLDGTPLENADGSQNFSGVAWEFRPGTQAQSYIQGIPGTENEISVGTEVSSETAWTHTFTNTQLSAVRVRLKWPSLMKQEDDGDVVGNTVNYAIDLQTDGGAWQTVLETAVSGKTTSGYERSHRIDLPQAGSTWTLRLRKVSPDANSARIGDIMTLQSYTEVIDAKLRYPHTALLYIEFDSSQFNGSIPQISCEPRGRVIRVPDNYNPETREYTGTWTGGFKWAWTDNPAWIYYDIVVSDRFGLGDRLTSVNISKWALYPIAQYCDQLVPDGRGGDGMEPRYICNVYVQERNDAYTVLRDFAAIFRGMTCWSGEQIIVQADMPRDVDFNYTRANIIGSPRYSSSTSKARYTNALVSWSDPDNAYADAMEPAFIPELVSRYSFNQLEVTAIGCTRQSEAHRKGLWGILTNNKDRMVEIDVGLDGRIPQPGYIIGLGDERLAGRVNGGRISAVNGRVITLDRDIDAKEGDRLHLNLPSGISQARTIQSVNGRRQVTVTTGYSETPEAECVWIVEYTDLVPQQYRVIGVKDNNNGTLTITGVAHDPDKFARIDTGAIIDQRPVSVLPAGNQSPPDDIVITSRSVVNQGISVETMQVNWSAVSGAISYEAQWRRNEGNWISVPRNSTTSFEVSGIYAGRYLVRVRAINAAEISSGWAYSEEKTLTGKVGEPLPPLALTTASLTAGIEIRWEFPEGAEDTQRTELQYSPDQDGKGALPLTDLAYPGKKYQQMGLKIATQFWYRARLIDRLGNASPWTGWVHGMSSDNVDDYYQQLDDAIKDTDTYEELTGGIKEVSDSAQAAKDAAQAAQVTADGAVATNKQQQQQLNDQLADIQQNAKDITDAANAGAANAGAIAQEILDRKAGDIATANKAASDVADAIRKAETGDAEVAAQAAANLLTAKNEVEAQISTTNTTMQDGFDSLAQQMASISAGTGEQFDSLAIWYFDNGPEGWASDDANTNLLPVDQDGWIYPAGAAATMRSPNPLAIDARSYKYMRLRMKRVGNPSWAGKLYWIGVDETGWNNARSLTIPAPDFDQATGITVLSIPDLLWATSGTVRSLRLDFSSNQNANNYYAVDWMAVGRPTPGASQAQIHDLRTAMTAADSAEAAARNTLAVQLRGNYEGTDPSKLVTGIIFNERQTRVTAEQAIASDVNTLRTDYNANKAAVTQRLDTLTSENQSQAQALTQLQSGLTDANGKIGANATAISQLKTDVTALDGRVTANSSLITNLRSDLNSMRVGGTNLIPNSGTLAGVSGVVHGQTYKGNAIRRIAIAAASAGSYDQFEYELAAPVDGTEVVVSFYAKANNADSKQIFVCLYNPNATLTALSSQGKTGSWATGGDGSMTIDLTEDWARYWVKYTRKSGQTGSARVIFGRLLKGSKDKEVYISSPKFEYGTMPTEWSEAPADNASASALQALTTRVTAAEGTTSTNSQAITQLKGDVSTLQGQMATKAEASALQQLATTVTQQGNTISSQGQAITDLQNTAQNGKAKYWLTKIFDIKVNTGYVPKLTDLAGVPPLAVYEMADAAKLDFLPYGDYKIAYVKALVYVAADKTIAISPGSRIMDDTGRLYINGAEAASFSVSTSTYSMDLKKGWNTLELVVAQYTGQFYINFGLKLSDNVDQLFSGAGQLAAASASQVLSSQIEQTLGKVDANSAAITTLNNSVRDINTALNNKADASALQSLTTRVTTAEGKITAQGNAITQLTSDLSTANGKISANSTAINNLTTRVSAAEGKIDSQAESITSINSSIKGVLTQAANLIPNPTVDPAYPQMGMTVVSTTSEGVPAGCPYPWAIKCQYRDHVPGMNNIPCREGQVFEFSVLAACGTGSAPFQHYIGTSTLVSGSTGSPLASGGQISAATGAQWTRTTWRWTVNAAQGAKGYFRPFLQINQSGPNFGTVWYATDWSVRDVTAAAKAEGKADANATAISQLTTRVTSAEGSITSQGQAITKLTSDLSTLTGVVNNKADASALNALTTRVSTAEGKIDSQGQSITQLSNSLSATDASIDAQGKIPGNLLANSSFERGPVNFTGWSSLASIITATQPHSGTKIAKMAAGGRAGISQAVEITQGRRYRFGVFAKQDGGTTINDPGNTKFHIADASGNLLIGTNYGPFTSEWQHVFMDWTATKTTNALFQLTTALSAGAMYFDDVYVVDITNDTKIQANADAITSLNTKVTQQGNDITSQGSAITKLNNSLKTVQYSNSNPWVDGSFESYDNQQAIGGSNGLVTTDFSFSGQKSLMCRRANGETGNSDKNFGNETAIRESAVYRFECWAMMPEDETPPEGWNCVVGLLVRNTANQNAWPSAFVITESGLAAGGGRGKWVKFSGKVVLDGAKKTRGRLWISCRGTSGGPGYRIYIDDLVITDVTDAHAAQTTADANSSAISSLTSTVTQQGNDIASSSSSITSLQNNLITTNANVAKKADATALNALQSTVTSQGDTLTSQGNRVTSLENTLTVGDNIVPNSAMLNNAQGWSGHATTVDGYPAVIDTAAWSPTSPKFSVTPGDILDFSLLCLAGAAINGLAWGIRFDGPSMTNNLVYLEALNYAAGEKKAVTGTITVPAGATTGYIQPYSKNAITLTIYNIKVTRRNAGTIANAKAITNLTNEVTQQGKDITSASSDISLLKNSLATTDATVAKKADSSALSSLQSTVTQQGKDISSQGNRVTSIENSLTSGANLIPNAKMLNGAQGWKGSATTVDGYPAVNSSVGWQPQSAAFEVTPGDILDLSMMCLAGQAITVGWGLRFDGPSLSNVTMYASDLSYQAGEKKATKYTFVVPAGATTAMLQRSSGTTASLTIYNVVVTRRDAGTVANSSAIESLTSTVQSQGNTLTSQGQAITKLNSDLSNLSGVVDTKASASALNALTTRVTTAEGKITANTTALTSLTSRVGNAESAIDGLNETTAANGLAMANGFQQLRAQIGDNQAAITQTNKAVVDLESSTAQQIGTIKASMDGMSATVQQTSTAVADINGKLSAQWGVKVQTDTGGGNPRIAGIQLGIDATGSSQFLVQADTFAVYAGGSNKTFPFVVQNGVAYMQEALIRDGSITNAKIGNEIKSNNFVDGSQGWRIGKDGSSQFNNVIVRGRVEANSGIFKGTVQAESFIGDIATSASFNGFTVKGGEGSGTMNAWYQNRGYPMTITLNCTVRCNSYSGGVGDQSRDFYVVLTFNINGVQSTRRVVVDMRDKAYGLVDVPQSFTVNIPASNNRIGISLTGASYGPQQSEVTVSNIVVTAFRSNNGSFGQ
ncbi:DUF1983 domain-containing protein [Klebsiella pneumoniae]|uniref:TipJ family phage tail tip protein n=1 Tax=Klebsiella pneumoniae TaxID=573 RepID=UPI0007C52979|nr:DUF1983 domain-containing protein [Klebsiella pneumoniae]